MTVELFIYYFFFGALAAVNIGVAYRMKKNYQPAYLTTIFYYVLVFSLGNFGTRVLIKFLLVLIKLDQWQMTLFSSFNFLFILWPLAVFNLYLMIKFVSQMLGRTLSRRFTLYYCIFWGIYLLTALVLLARMISTGRTSLFYAVLVYSGDLLGIGIRFFIMAYLVYHARIISDNQYRRTLSMFGYLWLAGLVLFNLGGDLLNIQGPLLVLFSIVYILPPLLILSTYLKKHVREHPDLAQDRESLEQVYRRYNISGREREVIALVAGGKSNREIADELYVSISTVKLHINSIYRKLNIKNRVQLSNFIRNSVAGHSRIG